MNAIIFDWDGTLADTLGALYRANVAVMGALGLPFDEPLYRRHFAPDWRVMYQRLGVPFDRLGEADALWRAAYDGGRGTELIPGAREALEDLRDAGFGLGLVTAGHRDIVGPQIERFGLVDLLPVRVFGDEVGAHKPDPRPLRRAIERLGLGDRPGETAYLGDVPDDMRMAAAAGSHPVGITGILGLEDDLRAAGAREIAPSVRAWVSTFLARRQNAADAASA